MKAMRNGMQLEGNSVSKRRGTAGNALLYFCVLGLTASSAVKFLHPPKAVAYMGSLGYENGMFFLIAALELLCAAVFFLRSTRPVGLLLVSSYLGGAIAAHLASHPPVAGGPFLTYMLNHPFVGSLEPGVFLVSAWVGTWLLHPEIFRIWNQRVDGNELLRQRHPEATILSRS